MSEELRVAIGIFDEYAEHPVTLGNKERLEVLCRGYAAAAKGWRFIATGAGDEAQIIAALEQVSHQLIAAERQPRGKPPPPDHLSLVLDPTDGIVIQRYFERDPQSLTLRHFVEAAFDAGEYDRKGDSVEILVQRLQRRIHREQ